MRLLRPQNLLLSPAARARRLLAPALGLESPLQGRIVLVTGASSGIGQATAHAVAHRGATVLLVARRQQELDRVRADVESAGGTAYTYTCDVTDLDAVDALVSRVLAAHGHVDYLVNNAGRSIRRSLEYSYDRFHDVERTMAVNFFGPVRLTMGLLPSMRARQFGHVVNVVTWGVQVKAPRFSAYIASKTALDTWSRIAGREAYGDNVTFTNLRLDLVRTGMIASTEAYRRTPAKSPERAAELVVRALEDRPITLGTPVAGALEVFNLALPRLSDFVSANLSQLFPDSAAARGEGPGE